MKKPVLKRRSLMWGSEIAEKERPVVMGLGSGGKGGGCGMGPEGAVKGLSCVSLRWGIQEPTGAIKFIGLNTLFVGALPGVLGVGQGGRLKLVNLQGWVFCFYVNVVVMRPHSSHPGCYLWQKVGEGCGGVSVLFHNCT